MKTLQILTTSFFLVILGTTAAAQGVLWRVDGNSNSDTTHFLGTTNGRALIFKTDAAERMRIKKNGNVGIGTITPKSRFHVESGAVLFTGTTGATPVNGPGTRLMWVPEKSAFRAGEVGGTQWNNSNIGVYSVGFGRDNTASGDYSIVSGLFNTASGNSSTVFGFGNIASGVYSNSFGNSNQTSGGYSLAFGSGNTVSGTYAAAIGLNNNISGSNALAVGNDNQVSYSYGFAFGLGNNSFGFNSTAIGRELMVNAYNSTALGSYNVGGGDPVVWIGTDPLLEIGNGTIASRRNAFTILKDGRTGILTHQPSHQLDVNGQARIRTVINDNSLGKILVADVNGVVHYRDVSTLPGAGGSSWTVSGSNQYSAVTGNVGIGSITPLAKLHVNGGSVLYDGTIGATPVSGPGTRLMWVPAKGAFRAGSLTTAGTAWDDVNIGSYSFAGGFNTLASGIASTAFGGFNAASGIYSTAIGNNNFASGKYSTALGHSINVSGYALTAIGNYNIGGGDPDTWISSDPLFEVGNGNSLAHSNAFTILKDGRTGILTHLPTHQLDVNGEVRIRTVNNDNSLSKILVEDATGVVYYRDAATLGGGGGSWTVSGSDQYSSVSGNVGIGSSIPLAKLQVSGGAVLYDGTTGATPVSGPGRRLMWVPAKAAFRAGLVNGAQWDDVNIGLNSFAFGENTIASGAHSVAFGYFCEATGGKSLAAGNHSKAYGSYAVSFGNNNTASGNASLCAGSGNIASGSASAAFGINNTCSGLFAYAHGSQNTASGSLSTAIGNLGLSSGHLSFTAGFHDTSSGYYSTTFGQYNKATFTASFASGLRNVSSGTNSHVLGSYSIASGYSAFSAGHENVSAGFGSVTLGKGNKAMLDYSFAAGNLAHSLHFGSMVFAAQPASATPFVSTGPSQFLVMAEGGAGINTNSPTATLSVNGDANKPGGGSWGVFSDQKLKKDVKPFEFGLELLRQIEPITYRYNGKAGIKTENEFVGVFAQDLRKIAPWMVSEVTYKNVVSNPTQSDGQVVTEDEDYLVVDPSSFDYLLINSIKEQQDMIDGQEDKISSMESEISELKELIRQLAGASAPGNLKSTTMDGTQLLQNEPNPFLTSTTIKYTLSGEGNVKVDITDFNNTTVEMLVNAYQVPGQYEVTWDAAGQPSGVYVYTLTQNNVVLARKMILVK